MKTEKHWKELTVDGVTVLVRAEVEGDDGRVFYELYLPDIGSVSQKVEIGINYEKAGDDYNFVADVMHDDFPHEAEVRKFIGTITSILEDVAP